MTRNRLGEMLRLYRKDQRMSMRDLAPLIGISVATLSRIERGYPIDALTLLNLWAWMLLPGWNEAEPPREGE